MLQARSIGEGKEMGFTRTPLPEEERRAANSLLAALEQFKGIQNNIPLTLVIPFMLVAANEGLSNVEYAQRAGVAPSSMSRQVLDLSISSRRKSGEGLGLLVTRPNPEELRRNEVYLTPRGRALAHRMLRAWALGDGGQGA